MEAEIQPGRECHVLGFQEMGAERLCVIGECADIGVQVERTLRLDFDAEAQLAQRGGSRKSRRWRNASRRCSKIAIDSALKQASAACWAMLDALMYRFCASFSRSGTAAGGATSQPSRQPVMPKYLEKLFSTNALSSTCSTLGASRP